MKNWYWIDELTLWLFAVSVVIAVILLAKVVNDWLIWLLGDKR